MSIPLAVMEALPALVKIGGVVLPWLSGEHQAKLRQDWAALITAPLPDDAAKAANAQAIRQYLCDRLQARGYTPVYDWVVEILVPTGLVTDCVDLLIDGKTDRAENGLLGGLFAPSPVKQRQAWATQVKAVQADGTPDRSAIIKALAEIVANAGRAAYYTVKGEQLRMDLGMLADMGEYLIG